MFRSSVLMSVMMIAFSVSQTAGPIIAVTKAAAAATDFFAVIDAPKPFMGGLVAPEVSATENVIFDSVTFACMEILLEHPCSCSKNLAVFARKVIQLLIIELQTQVGLT